MDREVFEQRLASLRETRARLPELQVERLDAVAEAGGLGSPPTAMYSEAELRAALAREDSYFNLGAAYTPVRNVDLALVYKRQTRDTATARQVSDEVGVFGQLRF